MKKIITIDTLNEDSVNKALIDTMQIRYDFNYKQVAKIQLSELKVLGWKTLSKHGIQTIGQASKYRIAEVLKMKGIGSKIIQSLEGTMKQYGVWFKPVNIQDIIDAGS